MPDYEEAPDFEQFRQDTIAATNWLRERFSELFQRRERSEEAYRQVFEEFKARLALSSSNGYKSSEAIRCLAASRNTLAEWLMSIECRDEAIEELHLALKDLDCIQLSNREVVHTETSATTITGAVDIAAANCPMKAISTPLSNTTPSP